jgi:hypothetical protein
MAYTVIHTSTKPSEEIAFFRFPQTHIDAIDQAILEIGDKYIKSEYSEFGNTSIIRRTFVDEAAFQEWLEKTSTHEDVIKARADRDEYNNIFGITLEMHVERNL